MANQLEIKLTELQVLKGALEILQDESKWTKGRFAKDSDGESCSPNSPYAICFCVIGAMRKAAGNDSGTVIRAITLVEDKLFIRSLSTWNDLKSRRHNEVVDALKKTIASIENV